MPRRPALAPAALAALAALALPACTFDRIVVRRPLVSDTGGAGPTAAECAAAGTWATVGHPLARTWCTGCHAGPLAGAARHGAPDGVDLDTLADWQEHGARALLRAQDGTMPPGGGLSEDDLAALEVWLACGAPGVEATLTGSAAAWGPTWGSTVWTRVEERGGALEVTHDISERFGEATYGRVLEEAYLLEGDEAWLLGWRWQDADEALVRAVDYDPPLPLQGPGSAWSADTTAAITTADDAWTEDQAWAFSTGEAAGLDPRSPDPRARLLLAVEAGGAEEGWHLSDDLGVTGRWALDADAAGPVLQQLLDQPPGGWPGFPLAPGDESRASLVTYGALE